MDRLLLLFIATVSVCAVTGRPPCSNPVWQTFIGQNSIGATQVPNIASRAACLNYCAQSTNCIAVDVDQTGYPPGCWLHTELSDLDPENVYDQPTTNQYRFISCSSVPTTATCGDSTWELYPDQTSTGAQQFVGPRTIQQCLDYCSNNTGCVAVDVDVNLVPLGCWPHFDANDLSAVNVYTQPGTNQYRLTNRCPVRSTSVCYNPEWSVLVGQSALGASQQIGPTSVQECLNHCGQATSGRCVAADVNVNTVPPQCWLHFSSSDLVDSNIYPQAGVNQYRLTNRCASSPITVAQSTQPTTTTTTTATTTQGPICPVGRWNLFRNQLSYGADRYVGPRSIQECLDYCNQNTNCVAVDIDVNVVPLGCWPHLSLADLHIDNIYQQMGTDQYQLVTRCTNPPQETSCYKPDWSVLANQSSLYAVQNTEPKSVQECLDYCGRTAVGCVAVDVDMTKTPPTCWPHLNTNDLRPENMFPQIGVYQYRLITKCANYPIGATTTTPTTTTTQGPVCPNGRWQVYPDQLAFGSDQYVGPRTIQQCLDYCQNRTDCVGVDIDVNAVPVGCWPHFRASDLIPDNIYDQDGTNRYQLTERCVNKPIVPGCYNPDWQVLLGQSSTGGVRHVGPTSVQQCLDYCGQQAAGCVAVDVDQTRKPYVCWLHFNTTDLNNLYQQDGIINQYRLITKCADYPVGVSPTVPSTTTVPTTTTLGPVCPRGRWQIFPNQIAYGATEYIGPRTVAQCLAYCNNRTDCVAVDINVNSVPVGCWPHFSSAMLTPDNIYPQRGTIQYRLLERCTVPQPVSGCYNPEWAVYTDQSAFGGVQYVGPKTVQECLDYCGQTAVGCLAVDVDMNGDTPTCWPHFSNSSLQPDNLYDQPGVNQYRLVTKCADSPITTTTVTPLSVTVNPTYGPQAGGTSVNITCQSCNMLNIAHVIFGSQIAPVKKSKPNSVVVISPASSSLAFSTLMLVTTDGRRTMIDPTFEYRVNPVFTDIQPLNHLIAGGTLVTVSGVNLDSVAQPMIQLEVATFYTTLDLFETAMIEKCRHPTDSTLYGRRIVCRMPPAVIPPDLQSTLELEDGMVSGNLNGGRGGVASAVEDDGRQVVISVGLIFDGLATYNNISATNPNILMDFHVQPAVYCSQEFDGVTFAPKISSAISIKGYGLLRGSQAADYSVSVGGAECTNVQVTDRQVTCNPPAVQPIRTAFDDGCQNGGSTLAVTAGYASYRCCIVYSSASGPNVGLIVGLTVGLVLPFLIIVFLVVLCCCCWFRPCDRQQRDTEKSTGSSGEEVYSTVSDSSTVPITDEESPPQQPNKTDTFNTGSFFWAPEKPGGTARVIQAYKEERPSEAH